ncbi:hypothetical protein E2C01_017181 [Portunus trituberculatus]|uniref:Uncharacterized protein n=1 Tax=Portunus trituberculatus TaxID=210409 RepID=A0A5B7DSR5_PORTR|nr:hypothetical protein [Portunus trituberculatus]
MYQSLSPLNRLTLMGILPSPSLIASRSSSAFPSCCSFSFLWRTGDATSPSPPTVMPRGRRAGLVLLHSLSVTVSGCFAIKVHPRLQFTTSRPRAPHTRRLSPHTTALSHCHGRVPSSPAAGRMVCAHPARLCACVSVRVAGEVDMSLDDGSLEASSISLVKSLG